MYTDPLAPRRLRFGVYELNLAARELRKHGIRIKLRGQPFEILTLLLEKPGEIVTREVMQKRLWPADTFVDFEHSLNSAIKKLLGLLGDSPENSPYIETIPRVGYRFVAPIQVIQEACPQTATTKREIPASPPASSMSRWTIVLILSLAAIILAGGSWGVRRFWPRPAVPSGRIMLAVLPFENLTGDAGQGHFRDGLNERKIAHLRCVVRKRLVANARITVCAYKYIT